MIIISHRGNIEGSDPKKENSPKYILEALNQKLQVEIDVWIEKGKWYLGHDKPKYKVDDRFLFETPGLWLHCKNPAALEDLCIRKINGNLCGMFFWHENDTYALTSNLLMWTYPRRPLSDISIAVMPELSAYTDKELKKCIGICTDQVKYYKRKLK